MHVDAHRGSERTARLAFAALMLANIFLALGPWLVRLADVGPVASAFWRMALAIPLLAWFALRSSGMGAALRPAFLAALLLGGLLFAADLAAWHYGILRTKLANATLFGNTSSFLFVLYGFLMLRVLPRPLQSLALLLAVAGAALLLGASYELSPRNLTGDLFALLGGFFYALYLIVIDRVRRDLPPMPVLALVTIAAAPPLLLTAFALGEQVWPQNWTPLVLLSLGSQVIGQGLLVYAMGHLRPAVVGIGLLTQPALTAVVGWLAYNETFGLADAAGALMICIALVLIRLPERRVATAQGAAH
jgi:drug/metabolite transporter (DMT)-like permease